jgi:hypothetical protein
MADLNLQEALARHEAEQPTLLPDGAYTFEVLRASAGENYIGVFLKVIGGPEAGKTVKISLSFTDKAMGIAFQNLAGFGIGKDEISRAGGLKDIATLLTGRVVEFPEFGRREHNGREYPSWPIGKIKLVSLGTASGAPAGIPAAAPTAEVPPAAPPAAPAAPAAPPVPPAAPAAPVPPAAPAEPVPPTAPVPPAVPVPAAPAAPPAAVLAAPAAPVPPVAPDGTPSPF